MKTSKIVFIGAGSMCFGLSFFQDVFISDDLTGSELVLVDLNEVSLDRMYRLVNKMNNDTGKGLRISKTNDRREAMVGADFVVNSLAIERCELWKLDFEIPKNYGVRQTLGENGGPGGLFFTMRTIPLILDIVRDMEEICPKAYFLNFSNPESRVILAISRYTKIKCIGLCHGIDEGRNQAAYIMGMGVEERQNVEVLAAGLNHFQWFLQIRDKNTGEDLYPKLFECNKKWDKPEWNPLCRTMLDLFGYYASCSGDHVGEYVQYGWEAGEHGFNFAEDDKGRIKLRAEIEATIDGTKPLSDYLKPSGERAVEVIAGIMHNKRTFIPSGIQYNRGLITNLPSDLAVEVPFIVDNGGIHPLAIGDLPVQCARALMPAAGVQQMSVEAAVNASKEMAIQAMLLDPVVTDTDIAKKIVDELWEINKKYIRKCI